MEGFRTLEDLKNEWDKPPKKIEPTYNPQKTEGKPYKTNGVNMTNSYYRGGKKEYKGEPINNKGDRHPTTIVKFNNPKKSLHRTQKPVELCEWLIKSYSNENDLVLDFTMGSGTTGEACKNTNRKFIGIEKDEEIFKIACDRLNYNIG
jgi:site-specific DNA-methyltransferase (adenine-specific)